MDERAILNFVEELYRLKRTPRAGYWYYGIEEPESVASHTFGVMLWTFILAKCMRDSGININLERALLMALFHEAGEAKLGDLHLEARRLIGEDVVSEAEKKAVIGLVSSLGDLGEEIKELFEEFEERKSKEAILVRLADKIELLTQAILYEKAGYRNLDEILNKAFKNQDFGRIPCVDRIIRLLEEMRK